MEDKVGEVARRMSAERGGEERRSVYEPHLALFPGLPVFCSSVFVQYNTRKRKSVKNGEGLGTPIT